MPTILPREVTSLEAADEESAMLLDGTHVREGDLIRYDNREDGGMSTAVVEQIAKSSQEARSPASSETTG